MRLLPDDRWSMVLEGEQCGEANSAGVSLPQTSRARCRLDGSLASRFLLMLEAPCGPEESQ
jgi:hypothetical protein